MKIITMTKYAEARDARVKYECRRILADRALAAGFERAFYAAALLCFAALLGAVAMA